MTSTADFLQLFQRSLVKHLPYIKRRLKADDVYIDVREHDFDVVMVRGGMTKTINFNKAKILGDNARMPLRQQRLVQPVCRFVDDIVMEWLR